MNEFRNFANSMGLSVRAKASNDTRDSMIWFDVELMRDGAVIWSGPYGFGAGFPMDWASKARPGLVAAWKREGGKPNRDTINSSHVRDQIVAAYRNAAPVDVADVLLTLQLEVSTCDQSFESWCGDTGFDEDSRKALAIYETCRANFFKLRDVFGLRFAEFMELEE